MSRALRCLALLPHFLLIALALFAFIVTYASISEGTQAEFWNQFYQFFRAVLGLPLAALLIVLLIVIGVSESEQQQPPPNEIDTLLSLKRGGNLTRTLRQRHSKTSRVTWLPPPSRQSDGDEPGLRTRLRRPTPGDSR